MDILSAIGNTSMVRLRKVVPPGCADVLVKLARRRWRGASRGRRPYVVTLMADSGLKYLNTDVYKSSRA